MSRLDWRQLEQQYCDVCDLCDRSGWTVPGKQRCQCFLQYAHHLACRYAGFSDQDVEASRKVKFSGVIPVDLMVTRRLAYVLIGNTEQTHAYTCWQIWNHLDLFTRHDSPEKKFTIQLVHKSKNQRPPELDILCTQLIYSNDFNTAEFYTDIQHQAAGLMLYLYLDPQEIPGQKQTAALDKARADRASMVLTRCGISRPHRVVDLTNVQGLDPWRGIG